MLRRVLGFKYVGLERRERWLMRRDAGQTLDIAEFIKCPCKMTFESRLYGTQGGRLTVS